MVAAVDLERVRSWRSVAERRTKPMGAGVGWARGGGVRGAGVAGVRGDAAREQLLRGVLPQGRGAHRGSAYLG
ncbi:hypothetical protein BS78_08G091700 [Paspalum vaginatum]|nr:hypothetical protein BS78_08G091700 [Paspalum vaginatum]